MNIHELTIIKII